MNNRCFVIQPFNEKYDDYYSAIFEPAIIAANLEPYRVDKDMAKRIPIETIEKEISDSAICFAEITENNPNVWYELGFAFACQKDIVMVSSETRDGNFPFDIRHKDILKYNPESPTDHKQLANKITQKLLAYLKSQQTVNRIMNKPLPSNSELSNRELLFLSVLLSNIIDPSEGVSIYILKKAMDKVSETTHDYIFAIKKLLKLGFIELKSEYSYNNEEYKTCNLTDKGDDWVIENPEGILSPVATNTDIDTRTDTDDDIPF